LEVEYLRPVPSGAPLRIEGRVVRSERRKHWTEASILDAEGAVLAHGKGLFFEALLGKIAEGAPKTAP
jgi:acyl-coenzyme A thioesterase PaaI-like protein